MRPLRQSTASQTRTIGQFIDDTDFKTPETALTIANTDIRLKKNGANDVAKNSGGATHDVNGYYHLTFDATDTDTVGELHVHVQVAGALGVWVPFFVLEEAIYDALFGASAAGFDGSGRVTVGALAADVITAAAIATDAITSSELAASAANKIRDTILSDATAFQGARIDAAITSRATPAQVNSEVDTALTDIHLDHLLAADYDPAAKPGVATALLNEMVESDAGVSRFTANALEQGPGGGSAPTAAQVADAVWDEARGDHVAGGSFGEGVSVFSIVTSALGAIADKILGRNLAGGSDGGRTVRQALRRLRNWVDVAAGVMRVRQEDDSTVDWQADVTTTPGDPISSVDPTT